jgi:hypothetical protein
VRRDRRPEELGGQAELRSPSLMVSTQPWSEPHGLFWGAFWTIILWLVLTMSLVRTGWGRGQLWKSQICVVHNFIQDKLSKFFLRTIVFAVLIHRDNTSLSTIA